ncbi:MAG: hypothetical protein ABIK09_11770 [Pseudomonadota bacterium]
MPGIRTFTAAIVLFATLVARPPEAAAKGTHFLAEGQVAGLITDTSDFGQASTLVLGFGGKFRGVPFFRFYLTGQVGYDWFDTARSRVAMNARIRQDDLIYTFGPRIYMAFTPRARLYFDLMFGGYRGSSEWRVNGLETYDTVDQGLAFVAGAGFQYRLLRALSLGLRFDRCEFTGRLNRRNLAAFLGFPEAKSEALLGRIRLALTLTAHF